MVSDQFVSTVQWRVKGNPYPFLPQDTLEPPLHGPSRPLPEDLLHYRFNLRLPTRLQWDDRERRRSSLRTPRPRRYTSGPWNSPYDTLYPCVHRSGYLEFPDTSTVVPRRPWSRADRTTSTESDPSPRTLTKNGSLGTWSTPCFIGPLFIIHNIVTRSS